MLSVKKRDEKEERETSFPVSSLECDKWHKITVLGNEKKSKGSGDRVTEHFSTDSKG